MTTKILYFTAGPVPTPEEKADIAALETLVVPPYAIGVRNVAANFNYGAGPEAADMIAGTTTGLTGVDEPYEDVPIFDPDSAAEGFATIVDGQVITIGEASYTFTVEAGVITNIVVA